MAGVGEKFISPFTTSEPCDSKLQQQPADCEDSPLLQFQLPDATLFNDSLDDDLNPDLLLEAKLPTESAAMECTDGYMPTVRVNLNDSLCCEDMDETQLPLGCDNELTTEDDKMEDSVKQTNLNDSLECEDMDETQLPFGGSDGGPVDASADKATSRVQETKLNDSLGCIDMDETQLNEDIGSSTTSSADKQAVSASELSDDSTLDQTAQCDGTKCLISDKKISSSSRDDKCATAETQQTVQPGKKSTEHKTSSSAVAKPAPTAGAKVKPSFSKKKSFVAPKTKTTPSTTNESPKPTVNSKPKKDKPKKSSPSSAKSPGFAAPPSTNISPSSSYATTPDTDDTEDCSVSNKSTDTEKSIKVQSGGKSTDKSIKSKHTKLTEKKVEQSAKKQEKEELKKERILKKQELERKRAEKEQLKQEKRLEQERKKAQREQMKMEKELKKLEQEKIRAEKFATAQKKKTKSQTKSKTKTTEKKASGITGDELGSDTSRQCEDSEISAEDTTKSADNNDQTEPEHHDEKASCDTDVQQISNEHAEPLIHSPSTSSKNGFENNQKEDEITVPPLNETATPLTVDSENAAVTSTDTDKPSPNEDSKIEQSSTDEESDSTNTPLSKLAVTKPDQPKTKVASKMFSPPKQQKDKKAKGLKKKSLNSHTPTKPAKTSKKKQPLKQPSTIANVQKGKKRKASIESDSEGGPQPKRSKSANFSGPVWVQCESSDCKKWRQLKDCQDPALVPDKWTCSMNSDENYNSCCAPEEQWSDFGDSQEFVESPFVPGSIVWAKMDGYPWWPAMIEEDPDVEAYYKMGDDGDSLVPMQYHVVFFDTIVCRAWVSFHHVTTFTDQHTNPNEDINVVKRLRRPLREATKQAKKALHLDTKERLSQFGFIKRYHQNGRVRKRKNNQGCIHRTTSTSRGRKSARLMTNIQDKPLTTTKHEESNDNRRAHDVEQKDKTIVVKKIKSSSTMQQAEE